MEKTKEKDLLFGFTPEEVELIRKTVGKDAVNEFEFQRFLYRANKLELNPLDGTIHLQARKKKNPETEKYELVNVIIVGIDGFRAVGDRTGRLAGIKREAVYNDKGVLTHAVAEVFRKDWNYSAREVAPLREYKQNSATWNNMPETMLKKCAEAAAHRMAWASMLSGCYIPEEMPLDDAVTGLENTPGAQATGTPDGEKAGNRKGAQDTGNKGKNDAPGAGKKENTAPPKEEKAPEGNGNKPPAQPEGKSQPPQSGASSQPAQPGNNSHPDTNSQPFSAEKPAGKSPGKATPEKYSSQVLITAGPTIMNNRVIIVGTDLSDTGVNLVGTNPEVQEIMKGFRPNMMIEVTGEKKVNGNVFVQVTSAKPVLVGGETTDAGTAETTGSAENGAVAGNSEDSLYRMDLMVSRKPSLGNYETPEGKVPIYWAVCVNESRQITAFIKKDDKGAALFASLSAGDIIEVFGKFVPIKDKEALLIDSMTVTCKAESKKAS